MGEGSVVQVKKLGHVHCYKSCYYYMKRAQSTLDCNTEQSNSNILFSVFNSECKEFNNCPTFCTTYIKALYTIGNMVRSNGYVRYIM